MSTADLLKEQFWVVHTYRYPGCAKVSIVAVVKHGCRKRPISISETSKRAPKAGGQDRVLR